MIVSLIMAIAYLLIAIYILGSFVKKEDNFYTSLNMMYGFFLLFLVFLTQFFVYLFKLDNYSLNTTIVSLNVAAIFFIIYSSGSIKFVSNEVDGIKSSNFKKKVIQIIFYNTITATIIIFMYNFSSPSNDFGTTTPIVFVETKLTVLHMTTILIQMLIIALHIPNIKEYKLIRIGIYVHCVRLLLNMFNACCPTLVIEITSSVVSLISMPIFVFAFRNIYKKQKGLPLQ